jgi:hypothetical protein
MSAEYLGMLVALRRAHVHAQYVYACLQSLAATQTFERPRSFQDASGEGGINDTYDPACNIADTTCRFIPAGRDPLTLAQVLKIQEQIGVFLERTLNVIEGRQEPQR